MNKQTKICLIGFMGAGKTTVAQNLAEKIAAPCFDLDAIVERRENSLISQIIEQRGEAGFRLVETVALREALQIQPNFVLALGGGAWTIAENRDLINAHDCRTIWLDAAFELCWQRIETAQTQRPLAQTKERARQLFAARQAIYQQTETRIRVRAEDSPDEIARRICERIEFANRAS